MDIVTYALAKKYTDKTADALGAVKGSPCTIKSAVHENGRTKIVFEWKGYSGTTEETEITVLDGTPIYTWESGESYKVGDLALYALNFYTCKTANSDAVFNPAKWDKIGGVADGDYSIVENATLLPSGFSSIDRKLYYSIEDGFFYLWDGTNWIPQRYTAQYSTMPAASSTYSTKIVQYIGDTTQNFTKGYFYTCTETSTPGLYEWENIGAQENIEALTEQQMTQLLDLI